ncbi:hypothetical protein [Dictyobacter formicarum]|uniref:Uncharacterized protein n=1 Tax=Dictyobacter formicarum TaxID=2778368 RepID=A0ABQ3VQF9_9CHLR|nr:hypothetical protein [Dictyobacter formicarum]GHO87331.1 hypothetical protein KSZ_53370 [Dictyobacter formicarum]
MLYIWNVVTIQMDYAKVGKWDAILDDKGLIEPVRAGSSGISIIVDSV